MNSDIVIHDCGDESCTHRQWLPAVDRVVLVDMHMRMLPTGHYYYGLRWRPAIRKAISWPTIGILRDNWHFVDAAHDVVPCSDLPIWQHTRETTYETLVADGW